MSYTQIAALFTMNCYQAAAIFIMTYFGVYFLIMHCLTTVYYDFFSVKDVLYYNWGARVVFASAAVLCFFLWGMA